MVVELHMHAEGRGGVGGGYSDLAFSAAFCAFQSMKDFLASSPYVTPPVGLIPPATPVNHLAYGRACY